MKFLLNLKIFPVKQGICDVKITFNNGNRAFYSNPELDQLLDDARQETDEAARESLYIDAQEIIIGEAPSIFIRHGEYLNAHNDNVHDFKANGFNMLDFSETYIEEE
ncbi:MAG TPA: hypothetical protein DEB42_08030 [Jeotgalicoccus sp.]|nr:hypothetical protein [Jeotgalicoccus sp.]